MKLMKNQDRSENLEIYFWFTDWKTQYCQDVNFSQLHLYI